MSSISIVFYLFSPNLDEYITYNRNRFCISHARGPFYWLGGSQTPAGAKSEYTVDHL